MRSCSALLNVTGLDFFTVYGPWGRTGSWPIGCSPMPSSKENLLKLLLAVALLKRDFTWIDDIVTAICAHDRDAIPGQQRRAPPLYNLGKQPPRGCADA